MASFSNFKSTIVQASQTAAGIATGVTVYANTDALPYVGNETGDQAYVSSNNRLYLWDSVGWYNIALINNAPNILSVEDSDGNTTPFELSTQGNTTKITILATDSDGDPITYSATGDSNLARIGSISQDGNEFTITPLSEDSATAESAIVTFKATDGVNISSSVNTFTLEFASQFDISGGTRVIHFPSTGDPTAPTTYLQTDAGITTYTYQEHSSWSIVDGALRLNGTRYRYIIHDAAKGYSQYVIPYTNAFSVYFWSIAPSNADGVGAGGVASYDFRMSTDTTSCGGGTNNPSGGFILQDNTWHHYAMISQSGSSRCNFYRDGNLISHVTMNSNIDLVSFSLNAIGPNNNSGAGIYCAYSDFYIVDGVEVATSNFDLPLRTATYSGF